MIANLLCLDLFDLDFFTVSSILVPWTEEVSGRCPETREGRNPRRGGPLGLAMPVFPLSSLEPENGYLNNHISPSVVLSISITKALY